MEPEFGVSTMAVNAMLDALDSGAGFLDHGGWQDRGHLDHSRFDNFDNTTMSEGWQEMSADDPLAATGCLPPATPSNSAPSSSCSILARPSAARYLSFNLFIEFYSFSHWYFSGEFGIPPVEELEMFADPPAPAASAPAPSRAFPAARAPGRSHGLAATATASRSAPSPAQPSRGPGAVAQPVQRDAAADLLEMMAEFGIDDTTVSRSDALPPAPARSQDSGHRPKLPPPPPSAAAKPTAVRFRVSFCTVLR